MHTVIPGLLDAAGIAALVEIAGKGEFVDGRLTAQSQAEGVKNNEQLKPSQDTTPAISRIVGDALRNSEAFKNFALPQRFNPPMLSRYTTGMYYDRHLDSPVMGIAPRIRTDMSMTLFLSPPESYEGGELIIELDGGDKGFKLPAGHAVIYDTSAFHRVAKVKSGERLAIVTWIQSFINDPMKRQIMRDVNESLRQVNEVAADSEVADLLQAAASNLFRMWAEV